MQHSDDTLQRLSSQIIARYSRRYRDWGYNVKTLGWGSREQQLYRFSRTITGDVDFADRDLLDLGCGFGDYLDFLLDHHIPFQNYIGWDLNPELIQEAQRRHSTETRASFSVHNLLEISDNSTPVADICIMLGVLNLNLKEQFDNLEYSRKAIAKAFQLARRVLIVDFLSACREESYPEEDFVFYHKPELMLSYAASLTRNFVLRHDYSPIPQKEFMLFLFK